MYITSIAAAIVPFLLVQKQMLLPIITQWSQAFCEMNHVLSVIKLTNYCIGVTECTVHITSVSSIMLFLTLNSSQLQCHIQMYIPLDPTQVSHKDCPVLVVSKVEALAIPYQKHISKSFRAYTLPYSPTLIYKEKFL